MSSLNYLELCRLCLVKDRVHIGIFEGEGEVRQIFLKIAACLPVKVRKDDRLPKQICDDCLQKVELLYQFWNQTANAEKQLLEWLGETVDDKTVETNVKHEHMEQDAGSELANSLSRVEAVLAEAREHESSDNDHFGDDSHKPETDSDDEPLSSLEPTQFINVNLNGSQSTTAQTQEEFLAPSAPSTSKSNVPAAVAQAAGSGSKHPWQMIDDEFPCQICGKMIHADELRLHALEHDEQSRYSCGYCGFISNKLTNIKEHIKHGHEKGDFTYSCEYCDKKFRSLQEIRYHISNIHEANKKAHKCEECSEVFDNIYVFEKHKLTRHRATNQPVNCSSCRKLFASTSSLKIHFKNRHMEKLKMKCAICGKLVYSSFYKAHLKNHQISKYHMCQYCGKRFLQKYKFLLHQYTHTGEKPHSCSFCGKSFTQKHPLLHHINKYHKEGQDCILCNVCDGVFTTKDSFLIHWMKHKRY